MLIDTQNFDRLLILYGSETGNSQDLAKIIAWTITCLVKKLEHVNSFHVELKSCDEYQIEQLPTERLILFVCSTTGIGEEPQNMKKFWRFMLRRDLPNDSLCSLSFAVIGLGDSSYLKYNFVAKKLHKRLLNLGATSLLELALGDDQHELGPYAKIDPWLKQFYEIILPIDNSELDDNLDLIDSSFQFDFSDLDNEGNLKPTLTDNLISNIGILNPYEAIVVENRRLTAEKHFQDVRLISLQFDMKHFRYNLGDVCCIYPENSDEDVETFLSLFDDTRLKNPYQQFRMNLSSISWISQTSFYHHLCRYRQPCTVRELVKNYLDLNMIPNRSFFFLFYHFSRNDLEKDMLKRFAMGTDIDELYDYVNRPRRTILEVMLDFPNTTPHVPFEYLLDMIPAMRPRSYSIASSPNTSPDRIELLYAVVNYRTRLRKPRIGLCTNWMSHLELNDRVKIFLRQSNFKLPKDHHERPLIMVGAGTGVAPFRAFIHDRSFRNVALNYLFFGCRYRQMDYYLEDEWNKFSDQNLMKIFIAFSRENPNESKVYVQNRIWEQRHLVFQLLMHQNGILWVAGKSQQYPQLIRETIGNIFKDQLTDDEQQVEQLIIQLERQRRIQFECW